LDVLAFRRELARPSRPPFWRRAYLDVGLALLCAVGYLELGQFGGTQSRLVLCADGGQSSSPLLLLTPALLLLAGGLLLLRLVPLAARLGTWLASRGRGLTTLLAFAQIERTPGRYARLTLLLTLAVGLGLFALVFDASLTQNVHDRTTYAVGADVRLSLNPAIGAKQVDEYSANLRSMPGVTLTTPLYRTYGSTSLDLGNLGVDILGVDTDSFARVAGPVSWRSDYAAMPLPDLMKQMKAHSFGVYNPKSAQPLGLWAVVSDTLAQQMRLKVGDHFQLGVSDVPFNSPTFIVGAIVQQFPTLYPQQAPGGFMVVDLSSLEAFIASSSGPSATVGPNEFWLRTNGNAAQDTKLMQTLSREQSSLSLNSFVGLREELTKAASNPTNGGMRGLLLIGAITAALLAVLGTLAQAVLAARQRTTQFAILRTLGMASRQLSGLLLGEQTVVYLFGLLGGTLLGLILTTATFPFLTFSDAAVDPTTVGVPAYVLRANWPLIGVFYAALVVAFLLALLIAARYAATIGLGKALRLGED
jgi:putative ABC transport system permease protein